jgi:hypothetical protein
MLGRIRISDCSVGIHVVDKKAGLGVSRRRAFGPRLTPAMAQELQKNAERSGNRLMWIVAEERRYFFAFPVTEDGIGSGLLKTHSLTELRQYLPRGLVRADLQPSEAPSIIEIWHPV